MSDIQRVFGSKPIVISSVQNFPSCSNLVAEKGSLTSEDLSLTIFHILFCGRIWKSENVPKYWIDTALERLCQNLWSNILHHLARSHTFCYASNNNTHLKKRKTNLEHSCYQRLGLCIIKSKKFKLLFNSFLYFKMFYFLLYKFCLLKFLYFTLFPFIYKPIDWL